VKSAVETLNPTRVKLSVEVPFDELKPSLDAAYKKIAQQINVPGFRKGRVPAPIIDQRVGREAVLVEAVNDALPELYNQALTENDITPLSQPELDLKDVEYGVDLAFTAELDIKPKIEMPEFHGLDVEVDDMLVTDEDVERQLETLRQRFATLNPVERPAASGDYVTIDLSAARDGESIAAAQATGMSYQIGSGSLLEGLDDALVGLSAGEEQTFQSKLLAGEYTDETVDVTVKLSAVKEQELPPLDDDFAQNASEFDTVEELREDLHDRVVRSSRLEQAASARDAVVQKLLSMVDVPLPDGVVASEIAARREALADQLSYAGLSREQYLESEGVTEQEHEERLERDVRESMAAQFILEEIVAVEEIQPTEGELAQLIVMRAQSAGVSPQQYMKHAVEHNHMPEIADEVRRGKALAHVVESANVTDKSGNRVRLEGLQQDGTYAESEPEVEGDAPTADQGQEAARPTDAAAGLVVAGDYLTVSDDPQ
jgi:trigger factor